MCFHQLAEVHELPWLCWRWCQCKKHTIISLEQNVDKVEIIKWKQFERHWTWSEYYGADQWCFCVFLFLKWMRPTNILLPSLFRHFSILVATDHNAVHYGENQRYGISEQPLCDISITVYWANVLPPHRLRTVLLFYCINQNHHKRENIFQFICLFIYFLAVSIRFCFPPQWITPERAQKQLDGKSDIQYV